MTEPTQSHAASGLRCPECGALLELGHDCLAELEPDPDARRDWDRDTQAMDEGRRDGEDAPPTGRAEA